MNIKEYEYVKEIKDKIEWLITHNKNYTNEQYYKLLDIQEIIEQKLEVE